MMPSAPVVVNPQPSHSCPAKTALSIVVIVSRLSAPPAVLTVMIHGAIAVVAVAMVVVVVVIAEIGAITAIIDGKKLIS